MSKVSPLPAQGAPGKDGDVGAQGPSGPAVSTTDKLPHRLPPSPKTHLYLIVFLPLLPRDPLVREERLDLLAHLDSRDCPDPREPLVRLASPESRY